MPYRRSTSVEHNQRMSATTMDEAVAPVTRILVGVDGSASAQSALAMAIHMAQVEHATVDVVYVWERPSVATYAHVETSMVDPECSALDLVAAEIDKAACHAASVPIRAVVIEGRPSASLIQMAKAADLAVLGSGHNGSSVDGHVGAVALDVARHAPCPVVLVPPPTRREAEPVAAR